MNKENIKSIDILPQSFEADQPIYMIHKGVDENHTSKILCGLSSRYCPFCEERIPIKIIQQHNPPIVKE
jgi:hypothetical protein